jgi:hypothetical protein
MARVHPQFISKVRKKVDAASQLKILAESLSRGYVMDKFRVIVWCESCRGDDEGCFGGSAEVIGAAFPSWDDAQRAGAHYCSDLPYRYRIEQDDPY